MMEDEDETFGGMYEDGHWVWDKQTEALVFISDAPPAKLESVSMTARAPTGAVEFRDDIDLIEQLRFKRRYQRKIKPGQLELVTLQDIKDIAIYTAPLHILSPLLINLLHLPTTERFLRALIFYCAYYLQIAGEMAIRMFERTTKIRTENCEILENEYKRDLSDLRLLVAKEYCVMLIGGSDLKRFHHMGSQKKRRSLSDKDARLFETFMHMAIQIVYLALGRKNYRQVELECHRVFKSEIFNPVEHTYKTGYLAQMTPEERKVLLGTCVHYEKKLNTRSPLINEVFCHRPIDYRLMGLGVVKYEELPSRLVYLHIVVAGGEEALQQAKITVGLIGMRRALFDTMLRPVNLPAALGEKSVQSSKQRPKSVPANVGGKSLISKSSILYRIYPDIVLPDQDPLKISLPVEFPEDSETRLKVSQAQRRRWLNRLNKLTTPVKHPPST
ncbi:hypothetical protein PYW07_015972 [Mythimna separata]|uniref:Protein phosphatase 1 regulatory subunit 36 n=1 Tax=Mythimna separata TaxID=271217 RepID=A0AAD7YQA4_MYTSE|nr:hypothetical protein PYW07_015972 [Mythimna separata]